MATAARIKYRSLAFSRIQASLSIAIRAQVLADRLSRGAEPTILGEAAQAAAGLSNSGLPNVPPAYRIDS